jgi:hypothetical protein
MKRQTKQNTEAQENLSQTQKQESTSREFTSEEELLRYDAAQTPVPPAVAERLSNSIQNLPKPATSWWRRLLDG